MTAQYILGIDLGTSALKAVLLADDGRIVAQQSAPLEVSRPHPQWSEQSPADWWRALGVALGELARTQPAAMRAVRAIDATGPRKFVRRSCRYPCKFSDLTTINSARFPAPGDDHWGAQSYNQDPIGLR